MEPLKLELMDTDEIIEKANIMEVTRNNMFAPSMPNQFEEDGFFSETIFGKIGSEDRFKRYGFIDLNCEILQPQIYQKLISMSDFFESIISGKTYVVFNEESGFFEVAKETDINAGTGYSFFMKHFGKMKFVKTGSDTREDKITLIEMHQNKPTCFMSGCLVIPAGLRDAVVKDERTTKDAINDIYTPILGLASALDKSNSHMDIFDNTRYKIQKKIDELTKYLSNLLDGKTGMLQGGGYSARKIDMTTRNVISSQSTKDIYPLGKRSFKPMEVMVGVYQTSKGLEPIVKYFLKTMFTDVVLDPLSEVQNVIDLKTKKLVVREFDQFEIEKLSSSSGKSDILNLMKNKSVRHLPVTLKDREGNDYGLFLIYDLGDKIYMARSLTDIENFLGKIDQSKVRFLTYIEFIYMATYASTYNHEGIPRHVNITRYPAIETGSSYPARIRLKSTEKDREVELVDLMNNDNVGYFPHYPIIDDEIEYIDSLTPHHSRLRGLGGDFDGDTCSANFILKDESNLACHRYLNNTRAYVSPDGKLLVGGSTDVINATLRTLTQPTEKHIF